MKVRQPGSSPAAPAPGLVADQHRLSRFVQPDQVGLHDPPLAVIDQTQHSMVEDTADQSLAHGGDILRRHGSLHD